MTKARPLTVALAAAGAVTLAAALGIVGGHVSQRPRLVRVSDDVSVNSFVPDAVAGKLGHALTGSARLAAGGLAGGAAISYLKFKVDLPDGVPPRHAEIWVARDSGKLPPMVELSSVPWSAWEQRGLTAVNAPRLGSVVASVFPTGYETALHFDVSHVIRKAGEYAFALTAPTSDAVGLFVSQESESGRAPTLTLQWENAAASAAAALKRLPVRTGTVAPPQTGQEHLQLPPWLPEDAQPVWVPETPPAPVLSGGGDGVPSPPPPPSPTGGGTTPSIPAPPPPPPSYDPPSEPSPSDGPSPSDTPTQGPTQAPSEAPSPTFGPPPPSGEPSPWESPSQEPSPAESPTGEPSPTDTPSGEPSPTDLPSSEPSGEPSETPSGEPSNEPSPSTEPPSEPDCEVGALAVPTCGVLWGVAPGAHTSMDRAVALQRFEEMTQRPQAIFHAYHRGDEMFPTSWEKAIARDAANPRILFLNWKPARATWSEIAHGDPSVDAYLDRLAAHIRTTFPEPFFFTMHHEPEDDVRANAMLGMTAKDYAAAYRYVVQRLRARGVTNLISTMVYMAYVPWNTKSWFEDLYPGDDVVDWVAWDAYAYSDPGYGHGDFAEMMNRRSGRYPNWPGFYTWAAKEFPTKPFMVAEWGVWYSSSHPQHQSEFFASVGRQMELFPRVKAMVYFETPRNQLGMDSRIHLTQSSLSAYRDLGRLPVFQVRP
jgi:hypothetical protein